MTTNDVWKDKLKQIINDFDFEVSPRGMNVMEVIGDKASYIVPMPACITLYERKVNYPFMCAEAAWILSGSNRLEDIYPYMKFYANFSDDRTFLRGGYGPKVVDQIGYVVDCIEKDRDTRQAVINIWRERPGPSLDIPCTLSMQFLLRNNKLYCTTTMRSNDIVKGFTYDVFTFSMISFAILLELRKRGVQNVSLGDLRVNAGSLHLYESDFEKALEWSEANTELKSIQGLLDIIFKTETYEDLIRILWSAAKVWSKK
jgi:thymidylate synthase